VAKDGLGPVTVLRDYHAENVMLVQGQEGVAHFGLLDFQDALSGHPAYDLASVLEDARRDVPEAIEQAMLERYIEATGNRDAFERAYWALAAQRNTRILGVFTRLWKRDNKPGYRRFQPRMWGLLERDLSQPWLEPVRDWFDANVGPEHRLKPWKEAA
jgi:aminoglycoside/choline kinase family phosphotransferase